MTPLQLPARWRLGRIVLSASLVIILALATDARGVRYVEDKDGIIINLREQIRKLNAQVRDLQSQIDRLKQDKARLEAKLAGLRNANAATSPPPAQPRPKRQITLAGLVKMNAVQARASAGCRFSGRLAVQSVEPVPGRRGDWTVTVIDPAALVADAATTRPASTLRVRCTFRASIPPALTVTPQKGATMTIAGDVARADILPEGAENPAEIRLELTGVEAGP